MTVSWQVSVEMTLRYILVYHKCQYIQRYTLTISKTRSNYEITYKKLLKYYLSGWKKERKKNELSSTNCI